MNPSQVAAIILAAGASRRLGRPKQLVEYNAETLIARAVRIARDAQLHPVIVVLGANADAVRLAAGPSVLFAENHSWEEGIASSMRAGLTAVRSAAPEALGALIMPCDQPCLTTAHLSRLADSFAGEHIVCSTYAGVRGVPAVLPRDTWNDLMNLRGDVGARKLLIDPARHVLEIPFEGGELDIDAPEDLDQLR